MSRPKQDRKIFHPPLMKGFKPYGIKDKQQSCVCLLIEEYESIRLLDYEGLNQDEAAKMMQVSRPTLTRIYEKARITIAQALVEGHTIKIEGGSICFDNEWFRCKKCFKLIEGIDNHTPCEGCPCYGNDELTPIIE